ncbi:unnamed protein product [Ilex paraguariensis]|uniref:YqaJ viral recombinase domain-containing protein n=1 Tax=Ilex paraguariensis TaxID=185542 RepID=A0ABC8QND4_9AQUA
MLLKWVGQICLLKDEDGLGLKGLQNENNAPFGISLLTNKAYGADGLNFQFERGFWEIKCPSPHKENAFGIGGRCCTQEIRQDLLCSMLLVKGEYLTFVASFQF